MASTPSALARRRMLRDPTPSRSARATAARRTRSLVRGLRGAAISRPPSRGLTTLRCTVTLHRKFSGKEPHMFTAATARPETTSETTSSPSRPATMRAVVQDTSRRAEALRLREIAKPVPADGEVLVRVRAAGLDRGVWHVMTGLPYLVRVVVPTMGLRRPKAPVRGMDLAGQVEA